MANSKLATYTRISPHNSGKRTAAISKITIHHMSGRMTARQCADYFATVNKDVSSNYCIGYDGSIAVSVNEDCRSWCSHSRSNDQAAVTIEVSNIANDAKIDPEWKVSDEAMAALIALCADVCKRNGIKRLWYDGTTNATLTRHCMFTSTDCPGPYLKAKTDYICAEVNKLIGAATEKAASTPKNTAGTTEKNKLAAGTELRLEGVALYSSSVAEKESSKKTGTFYVWSDAATKKRIRITNSKDKVGVKGQVTGWITVADAEAALGKKAPAVFEPYLIIIPCSVLNVRKGPGTDYVINTRVRKGQVFTIVEEKDGWGKLKSGAGWLYLGYTRRK